jgi:hypothetical protein
MTNYGYNDNSCQTEQIHSCSTIAYPGLGPMQHQVATEATGTYDDPITAAASGDNGSGTGSNESQGGATLSPGTIIYNTITQKYYIMEDQCAECTADYNCKYDDDEAKGPNNPPAGCMQNQYFHIDFWMGPNDVAEPDAGDLTTCEYNSTIGDAYNINNAITGPLCAATTNGTVIINPPSNLPVRQGKLYKGDRVVPGGGCWTNTQVLPSQGYCQ